MESNQLTYGHAIIIQLTNNCLIKFQIANSINRAIDK